MSTTQDLTQRKPPLSNAAGYEMEAGVDYPVAFELPFFWEITTRRFSMHSTTYSEALRTLGPCKLVYQSGAKQVFLS